MGLVKRRGQSTGEPVVTAAPAAAGLLPTTQATPLSRPHSRLSMIAISVAIVILILTAEAATKALLIEQGHTMQAGGGLQSKEGADKESAITAPIRGCLPFLFHPSNGSASLGALLWQSDTALCYSWLHIPNGAFDVKDSVILQHHPVVLQPGAVQILGEAMRVYGTH